MDSVVRRYITVRDISRDLTHEQRRLTLETVSGLGNLSTRFLSEFERGKVLKALRTLGLEVVIQPRGRKV
ncbi:MAG: hypothetical protein Q8L89_02610 [Gammaproteobacteria bacterium]|nr:hypothetical protein [Gammaproteobacteria bacterium]